uniref:Uncharacterized protein n=1 Tax=Cucumis melo TaxID=3656 RepID=A0A9I9E719_CUCME
DSASALDIISSSATRRRHSTSSLRLQTRRRHHLFVCRLGVDIISSSADSTSASSQMSSSTIKSAEPGHVMWILDHHKYLKNNMNTINIEVTIDEVEILILKGKEMEAAFENLNNDSTVQIKELTILYLAFDYYLGDGQACVVTIIVAFEALGYIKYFCSEWL